MKNDARFDTWYIECPYHLLILLVLAYHLFGLTHQDAIVITEKNKVLEKKCTIDFLSSVNFCI